jgi:hypothetical protein
MTPSFAVIAEGPSDFEVLRYILAGFFADPDVVVNQLQPAVDATTGRSSPGGWYEVFRFIGSSKFTGAFERADFVVIHIDTDVCEAHFGVARRHPDGHERTAEEMLTATIERLVHAIDPAVFSAYQLRIIFAVAVESIECWLLPLVYNDKRREKLVNCLGSLNSALSVQKGFSIDPADKQVKYYRKFVRDLGKRKTLDACWPHNPSFRSLIQVLEALPNRSEPQA